MSFLATEPTVKWCSVPGEIEASRSIKPKQPWLVVVWPGMGTVALSVGYILLAKCNPWLFPWRQAPDVEAILSKSVREMLFEP